MKALTRAAFPGPPPSAGAYRVLVWQRKGVFRSPFALVATGPIVASVNLADPLRSACDSGVLETLGVDSLDGADSSDAGLADGTTNEAPAYLIALAVLAPAILVTVTVLALWKARGVRNRDAQGKMARDELERHGRDGNQDGNRSHQDGDDRGDDAPDAIITPQPNSLNSSRTRLPPLSVASSTRSTNAMEQFFNDSPEPRNQSQRELKF